LASGQLRVSQTLSEIAPPFRIKDKAAIRGGFRAKIQIIMILFEGT